MQQIIDAMTMADLRAEVASLKEEQRNTADLLERAEDALRERDQQLASLREELASEQRWASDYMQQLAAANGRVGILRVALEGIADLGPATTECCTEATMAQIANEALSNLNEDGKA
jgi:chromosome segregation ATPase